MRGIPVVPAYQDRADRPVIVHGDAAMGEHRLAGGTGEVATDFLARIIDRLRAIGIDGALVRIEHEQRQCLGIRRRYSADRPVNDWLRRRVDRSYEVPPRHRCHP